MWLLWDWTEASPAIGSGGQRELRRGLVAVQEAKEGCEKLGRRLRSWRVFLDRQSALWIERQWDQVG